MSRTGAARGMTLIEILVVMVLIAILASVVGPSVSSSLDRLLLQRTAAELAARFRKAGAMARSEQVPVAVTYEDHEFRFLRNTQPFASFRLAASISPPAESATNPLIFLPSGQIVGLDHLQLRDDRGRQVTISMDFLRGVRVGTGVTP